MSRRPKPTALRLIEGDRSHGKPPINQQEPKPASVKPPCPRHLDKDGRYAWRYVVRETGAMGTLASSDQATLAAYAEAWSDWVRARREIAEIDRKGGKNSFVIKTVSGNYIQNPWLGVANKARANLVKIAAELGLNPVQRTRIRLDMQKEPDLREKLLRGMQA